MTQLTTTLKRIKAHNPSHAEWTKLLAGLGKTEADAEPLPFATILRINGLVFALWCARAEPQHAREWRLYAVWCARQAQHLMRDPRSIAVLDVAERYANGMATDDELRAARDAAWAARDAAWAALATAGEAARDAARDAALAAARDAARAAARAAGDGERAAGDGERQAQTAEFLRLVGGE